MHCQYMSEKEVETKTQTNKEKRNYFIDKEDLQVNKLTIRGVETSQFGNSRIRQPPN